MRILAPTITSSGSGLLVDITNLPKLLIVAAI
jgi:hypothetical protein